MNFNFADGNINIFFSDEDKTVQKSGIWKIADWNFQFLFVPANNKVIVPKEFSIITIYGKFTGLPFQTRFAKPKTVRKCSFTNETELSSGSEPAIAILFWQEKPISSIQTMDEVKFQGPLSENLNWINCENYNWGENFKNLEFFNLRGFKLHLKHGNKEQSIGYVQFWTAGKGVNCGLHDHSDLKGESAFCEIHFGMHNGTKEGGMVYLENGKEISVPVLSGEEHGPFWNIKEDGTPVMREDGSVVYPTHKWQAGGSKSDKNQAFDLWAAIELIPSQSHCDSLK